MAGAAKGKVAKTASKNNPSSRKAARKMFFNGVQVKPVRVIGVGDVKSMMAIASFKDDELLVDANGMPYDFKFAKPEAL